MTKPLNEEGTDSQVSTGEVSDKKFPEKNVSNDGPGQSDLDKFVQDFSQENLEKEQGETAAIKARQRKKNLKKLLQDFSAWMISGVLHLILLLICALIIMARNIPEEKDLLLSTVLNEEDKGDSPLLKERGLLKEQDMLDNEEQDQEMIMEEDEELSSASSLDRTEILSFEKTLQDFSFTGLGMVGSPGAGINGTKGFQQRSGNQKKRALLRSGGSKGTESAVLAALDWLARHQNREGTWDLNRYESIAGPFLEDGVHSLALLAFIGAGHTTKIGKFKPQVQKAVNWLLKRQWKDGGFRSLKPTSKKIKWHTKPWYQWKPWDTYNSSLAILALSEAYGMGGDSRLKNAVKKGVRFIIKVQKRDGGWAHEPPTVNSTSVLGWMIMALKSARMAGIYVPPGAFRKALRRLDSVTVEENGLRGMVGYSRKEEYVYSGGFTMTAVGMLCFQYLGLKKDELTGMADILLKHMPQWKVRIKPHEKIPQNFYHWYYVTLALYQMGGKRWDQWNKVMIKEIMSKQIKTGPRDGTVKDKHGSWNPETTWDPYGGRVYSTAMGALCFEVYYRYLSIY